MDGSKSSPVDSTKPDVVEREMHLVMTGRVASHTIGLNGATQNIDVVEIGTSTIEKAISAAGRDIDNIGMVSMDSLFCPYVIGINWEDHSSLPHWEEPVSGTITATDLNPFNPAMAMTSASIFYESGPNLGIYNSVETLGEGDFCQFKNLVPNDQSEVSLRLNSIKAVGFKAPLILTGWGYDTSDKPVPADSGNPDVFASGAFRNPSLWKSGPLDVRWDQSRAVWSAGTSTTKIYLSKVTNTYNPSNFSYEVERSSSRDQFSRVGPTMRRDFDSAETIYDPEQLAYNADENNIGAYEKLDYTGLEFPHYEAFIIRQTTDDVGPSYYNIWSEDCSDCGHVSNPCNSGEGSTLGFHGASSVGKKILIENPLKQSLEAGDLCFTVKTGRSKNVNTGSFVGGSGVGASGNISVNAGGTGVFNVTAAGSGYTLGGFGLISSGICLNLTLAFNAGAPYGLASGTILPSTNLPPNKTYSVSIYPANSTATTESLPIHWIMQAEFKSQQVITHIECDHGMLQTCSVKIQTQGQKSCEWCGEDSALSNSF